MRIAPPRHPAMIANEDSAGSATRLARLCVHSVLSFVLAILMQFMTPADATAQTSEAVPKLTLIQELTRIHTTTSVTWSSDGSKLAAYMVAPGPLSTAGKLVTVWNAEGRILREIEAPDFFFFGDDPLAFAAGGEQLVTTPWLTSRTLGFLVFDIESGKVVREVPGPDPDGYRTDNGAMAFVASPDGSILAVVFGFGRTNAVSLYSTRDLVEFAKLQETAADSPSLLAFSADGKLLAVDETARGKILIYDLAAKRLTQTLVPFPDYLRYPINTIALSPDGSLIAVGTGRVADDTNDVPVRVFRVKDGSTVASLPGPSPAVFRLAWSPDGRFIAFTKDAEHRLYLWNPLQPRAREQVVDLTGHTYSLAFSPDGSGLAVCHGNKVAIYDIAR